MIRYCVLHLRRNLRFMFITFLCYLSVLLLIMSIQQSVLSRQSTLEKMAKAIDVKCTLVNADGRTTYMSADSYYANTFLDTKAYSSLVKQVVVKGTYYCRFEDYTHFQLSAITDIAAEESFQSTAEPVLFDEGYDHGVWMTDEAVCILSDNYMDKLYTDEYGNRFITFIVSLYSEYYQKSLQFDMTLRVIGSTPFSGKVLMPYNAFRRLHQESGSRSYYTIDSMYFYPRDNASLAELRIKAYSLFKDKVEHPSIHPKSVYLVINDVQYLKLIREAQRNLSVLKLMQPILHLCALGAGVMLVVMQMRSRKKEMAVIRSLGAGRFRVMVQSILEYAIICLPVTLFALLVWRELSPMTVFGVWLAFMAGALCTIVRFSMVPLVKQIRELEE